MSELRCANRAMKRGVPLALLFFSLFILTACAWNAKPDTSAWQYYSFEELGIALRLPEDMVRDQTNDRLFIAGNADILLTVGETGELYADMEHLAAALGADGAGEAEVVTINGAVLVRAAPAEGSPDVRYHVIGPEGDAYQILLSVNADADEKHGGAVLTAVTDSICSCGGIPDDAQVIRIAGASAGADVDSLVLVNKRHAMPEGWGAENELVRTTNSLGNAVRVERTACKAFFDLQKALAAEGVNIELDSAYRAPSGQPDYSEYSTGLALDISLNVGGMVLRGRGETPQYPELWTKVHSRLAAYGFILRCPEGGEYYTGCGYEPWHIRYVGAEAAREIAERGTTLEEYLGADPAAVDYLVLVNPHTALPEAWEDTIEIVYMTNRHGTEIGVERTAYAAYCALRDALAEEGVHLDINSAYRSVAEQQTLAKNYLDRYGQAYVDAYVAVPGYSEHHTGLALDLYLESMDVWAKIHARLAEFGFILRYPEGKEAVTGYAYEPWHVRYVGVDAAEEITSRGITLEEYLDDA